MIRTRRYKSYRNANLGSLILIVDLRARQSPSLSAIHACCREEQGTLSGANHLVKFVSYLCKRQDYWLGAEEGKKKGSSLPLGLSRTSNSVPYSRNVVNVNNHETINMATAFINVCHLKMSR